MPNLYIHEEGPLSAFKPDQTCIINERYLKYVSRIKFESPEDPPTPVDWYPFANSYYPYIDFVDTQSHANYLMFLRSHDERFNESEFSEHFKRDEDFYSTSDIQLQYLYSHPVSFIILSKPEIGETDVGKQLADHWKAVYIDPESLIKEELASNSRSAYCMEFNLRCGRAIDSPVILYLLKRKMNTDLVKHRGMVVCGFPLIPNNLYEEDPISSESAIFTSKEICEDLVERVLPEVVKNVSQAGLDETTDPQNRAPKRGTFEEVNRPSTSSENEEEWTLYNQMECILQKFEEPFVITYLICDNWEALFKRKRNRLKVYSNIYFNLQEEEEDKEVHTIFKRSSNMPPDSGVADDLLRFFKSGSSNDEPLVRKPHDFHISIVPQLEVYNSYFLLTIEKYVINHDPDNFIRVDGRLSPSRMFSAIRMRLRVLPLQRPIIPEKILEKEEEGEGGAEPVRIPSTQDFHETFTMLSQKRIPSVYFKWTWSDWGQLCPVAMVSGIMQEGDPNLAVHFMNRIFFPADENALEKFTTNPRPFLVPPFPKSSCRIFIFGPKGVGESSIARCLACLLKGVILNYEILYDKFWTAYVKEEKDRVRSQAIVDGIKVLDKMRKAAWTEAEQNRHERISEWLRITLDLVEKRMLMLRPAGFLDEYSSFPEKLVTSESSGLNVSDVEDEFLVFGLDFFHDRVECRAISEDHNRALQHLPEDLATAASLEPASAFDDFVQEFANDAVASINIDELTLSSDRINKEILDAIRIIEEANERKGGIKGGWIIEAVPLTSDIIEVIIPALKPGEVYVFIDRPPHDFIVNRFRHCMLQEYIDLNPFFQNLGKLESAVLGTYVQEEAIIVVKDILSVLLNEVTDDVEYASDDEVEKYKTNISHFVHQWAATLPLLQSLKIKTVEFDVTNKSMEELLIEVVKRTDNLYKCVAVPMEDFQIDAEVSGEGGSELDELKPNRRFGDTFQYCPVALHQSWCLWKGKKQFAASFDDKIYLMSSEAALSKFVNDPRDFLRISDLLPFIPPARICIVGPTGTGKTVLSKSLARNFGLHYVSLADFLKNLICPGNPLQLKDLLQLGSGKESGTAIEQWIANGAQIPEHFMNELYERCWGRSPTKHFGFVLDGFPSRPCDVGWMVKNIAIPDVVVELSINLVDIRNRLVNKLVEDGDARLRQVELRNQERIRLWKIKRDERFQELSDLRKEQRYLERMAEKEAGLKSIAEVDEEELHVRELEEPSISKTTSQITYDSIDDDKDLNEINNILDDEIPPPRMEEPIEITEQFVESYLLAIEEEYNRDLDFLRNTRLICEEENIPWMTVDAAMNADKLCAQTTILAQKYKLRTRSHLESVYNVPFDMAESLLTCGYYFLSKFGRTCPVQVFDKSSSVQMFLPAEENQCLYPMLHRQYIYYVVGKESRDKFKDDPLKYVLNKKVKFPLVPVKVAIIGPPKCGKTTLARRFRTSLGLKVITRGQSIRYVLQHMKNTPLGIDVETLLRWGFRLPPDLVMKCVEALTFDGRCISQGIVYDGFPENYTELKELLYIALLPNLILDLRIEPDELGKFVQSVPRTNNLPRYSKGFIDYRSQEWFKVIEYFSEYVDREFENRITVKVDSCRWGVWDEALKLFEKVMMGWKDYYRRCFKGKVVPLTDMLVTPMEFNQRKGVFKQYCPCCWYYRKQFITGGNPPCRKGMVQYCMCFYYVCPEHQDMFRRSPRKFLPPRCRSVLPYYIPSRVKLSGQPIESYEDGYCIICFWDNQPYLVLNHGKYEYAVLYNEKFYLFNNLSCLNKFMREPQSYCDKRIHFKGKEYKSIAYRQLPILGVLEQYEARSVVKAVTNTGILRPIIPGLTIEIAAAINIGLYLKLHNVNTPDKFKGLYEEQHKCFHQYRKRLIWMLSVMKQKRSPYIHYEEPLMNDPEFYQVLWASRAVSRISASSKEESTLDFLGEMNSESRDDDCL